MLQNSSPGSPTRLAGRIAERLRRALSQFLTIPLLVVFGFVAAAFLAHLADVQAGGVAHWGPVWTYLGRYVGDPASATSLLSAIASGLITVTSITFSILLLAVQQGASALNSQIVDHYLRRRSNQVYFGCFVGVSIYTLVTLVLTTGSLRPVLGVMLATSLAGGSLFSLIPLIYSTIEQIKPVTIINNMHDAALATRNRQLQWLRASVEVSADRTDSFSVRTDCNGYLARVRMADLHAIFKAYPASEFTIEASVGDYLVHGATLATVLCAKTPDEDFVRMVRRALPVEEQRDVDHDAAFAIDQIGTIAWTSISTAKSNPAAALIACHALQDILSRWSDEAHPQRASDGNGPLIAYHDNVGERLLDSLESIFVVASESMQHQCVSVAMEAIAASFPRMPVMWKDRADQMLRTSVTALGDHLPTAGLRRSFAAVTSALHADGRHDAAECLATAWSDLEATRGTLHSRGNRDAGSSPGSGTPLSATGS